MGTLPVIFELVVHIDLNKVSPVCDVMSVGLGGSRSQSLEKLTGRDGGPREGVYFRMSS